MRAVRAVLIWVGLIAAGAALAEPPKLALSHGPVRTDPAGAFVDVRVKNTGPGMVDLVVVSCEFFAQKISLGSSTTSLFAIAPNVTGADQVRLIGGNSATDATCVIAPPKG